MSRPQGGACQPVHQPGYNEDATLLGMHISVVIPTYRRGDALCEGLRAQRRQLRRADEILVVARPDDEPARDAIRTAGGGLPIRIVDVQRPGLVAALNAGLAAATGDIVAFTDDDAEPHADWLARIEAAIASDPCIGAVGGRDWVFYGGKLVPGEARVVGRVSWYGRVTGNHHAGIGGSRDVHVLKGANMAFRRDAIAGVGFDERLRGVGTEHHSELGACLRLRASGWRVVYDPAVAVDHRPAPRVEGHRELGAVPAIRFAAHNETLAMLEYLPRWRRVPYFAWAFLVGTVVMPGPVQLVRSLLTRGRMDIVASRAALQGRLDGRRTFRAGRSDAPASVLAIGHSPYGAERARQLLAARGAVIVPAGAGWRGIVRALRAIATHRADVVYLIDVGMSTAAAAAVAKLFRRRIVLDTGDLAYELARSVGGRSRLGLMKVALGEHIALRSADHVVVRGRAHLERLNGTPGSVIPDLPPEGARPVAGDRVRQRLGVPADAFVVGLVGSLNWAPRLQRCYGWDLVEALATTPETVHALIVGDGDGREWLERRASAMGVASRCHFAGRIAPRLVAESIGAMDAAISTQTNDAVGAVRTTGKLPLYLACGCPVIASHVGEAARLLGPLGWTIPYHGTVDPGYPERLAEAIARWARDPEQARAARETARRLAADEFDPEQMRRRLTMVIEQVAR